VVSVDADFQDEYPGGDTTCTEAYASLCRTGEALLSELDRRIVLTFDMHQAAATALAVIDGAGGPLTPSQVSDRVLIPSATMTATLDLLEHRGWIRRIPNPGDRRSVLIEITPDGRAVADELLPGIRTIERSILSALTPDERACLLDMLAKILARTAEAAAEQPEPLTGQRIRPARLGGLPQRADLNGQQVDGSLRVSVHPEDLRSRVAAGDDHWLLVAVRGHLGDTLHMLGDRSLGLRE
jgi:DNA-binding MarR family transcriptional regulator